MTKVSYGDSVAQLHIVGYGTMISNGIIIKHHIEIVYESIIPNGDLMPYNRVVTNHAKPMQVELF